MRRLVLLRVAAAVDLLAVLSDHGSGSSELNKMLGKCRMLASKSSSRVRSCSMARLEALARERAATGSMVDGEDARASTGAAASHRRRARGGASGRGGGSAASAKKRRRRSSKASASRARRRSSWASSFAAATS